MIYFSYSIVRSCSLFIPLLEAYLWLFHYQKLSFGYSNVRIFSYCYFISFYTLSFGYSIIISFPLYISLLEAFLCMVIQFLAAFFWFLHYYTLSFSYSIIIITFYSIIRSFTLVILFSQAFH